MALSLPWYIRRPLIAGGGTSIYVALIGGTFLPVLSAHVGLEASLVYKKTFIGGDVPSFALIGGTYPLSLLMLALSLPGL